MDMNITLLYKDEDLDEITFEDVEKLTLRGGWISFQQDGLGFHINRDQIDTIITAPVED